MRVRTGLLADLVLLDAAGRLISGRPSRILVPISPPGSVSDGLCAP